jgi:hypothetical protein
VRQQQREALDSVFYDVSDSVEQMSYGKRDYDGQKNRNVLERPHMSLAFRICKGRRQNVPDGGVKVYQSG